MLEIAAFLHQHTGGLYFSIDFDVTGMCRILKTSIAWHFASWSVPDDFWRESRNYSPGFDAMFRLRKSSRRSNAL